MRISDLIDLLNQTELLVGRCDTKCQSLVVVQNGMLELGNGLLRREITLIDNPELVDLRSQLDSLLQICESEGANVDIQVAELAAAKNTLEAEPNDPNFPSAIALALQRQDSARSLYELAHLACEAFGDMENFAVKLKAINPTASELSFLTEFRLESDRFFLAANYLKVMLNNFANITWQIYDWLTIHFNDPRNKIQQFNDNLPFALLPVRLETRFMTIKHVRDNLAFGSVSDVFRSEDHMTAAQSVENEAILLAGSEPLKGGTLEDAPAPEAVADAHELWVRIYPDEIAIHTHEDLLSQDEVLAGKTYWDEMWKIGISTAQPGRDTAELGAWRVLCSGAGPKRAAWIAKQTTPNNILNRPSAANATSPVPQYNILTTKPAGWTQQAHTKVMPDRFVVRVYNNSSTYREVVGSLVPNPLPVGFDPANSYGSYLNQSSGGLNMPPDLRWLTEFEEAEKVGMGIRIPLQGTEKTVGFERLLVLGYKQSISAAAGTQLLEELFNNHHYSSGLAIVPQGTATNNTEAKKSGYTSFEPGQEESFAAERKGDLFNAETDHYKKADGQRLAEALGIGIATFQNVAHANSYDVKESMAMGRALWSATLGYYMKNMLTPAVVSSDIVNTRNFFLNFVHGRGLIPAFRVRNQPYGVLPTTVYSRWKFADNYTFEAKMHRKVLDPLRLFWQNNLCSQVPHVDPPYPTPAANPDDLIVRILGLHPASLEFHQRVSVGKFMSSNMVNFLLSIGWTQTQVSNLDFTGLEAQLHSVYSGSSVNLTYSAIPRILGMGFSASHRILNGPVVDTLALSEKRTIQKILNSNPSLNLNYIGWLQQSPLSNIRNEDFTNIGAPNGQAPPQALLYLLLRYAWFLEYLEASHCVLTSAQIISVDAWFNQEFIKITGEGSGIDHVTEEQKELLHGVVKSEVNHEYGLVIDNTMRNLETNEEYHSSGMTPQAFEEYLRNNAIPFIEDDTAIRYGERLAAYNTEQAQWQYLTGIFPGINETMSMEDHLAGLIGSASPCTQNLNEAHDALGLLKTLPTARLERCLAEHLDTCAFRLDSWLNGLVLQRMKEQREATTSGIYVGAYGILEKPHLGPFPGIKVINLSDSPGSSSWSRAMTRLAVRGIHDISPLGGPLAINPTSYVTSISAQNQQSTFIYLGSDKSTRLIEDPDSGEVVAEQRENPANQGFILAPSLNHAVAAAILRAGYVAHKNTNNSNDAMAVTLTSARVRTATYYLDGVRNGQNLAALLGYRFERGIHDHALATTISAYLFELRAEYPLVAESVVPTTGGSNRDAQTNHVVNGLQLLQTFNSGSTTAWASGITGLVADTASFNAIKTIILKVKDDLDAIGDLLLSESVYQVSRGNSARAGAVLNALGAGESIPEPEIIKTPRQANTLTHRCMVQLQPAATANSSWTGSSNRATAEPSLNNWLASQLPDASDILISVGYESRTGTSPNYVYTAVSSTITIDDLGLQPIDLLTILNTPGSDLQADASELSRRVIYYVQQNLANHDDKPVTVDYRSRVGMAATDRNIFEMMPMVNSLIQIVSKSRAAEPEDFMVPGLADAIISANLSGGALINSGIQSRLNTAITDPSAAIGLLGLKNELDKNYTSPASFAKQADTLLIAISPPSNSPYSAVTAAPILAGLRAALMYAANFGIDGAVPETSMSNTKDDFIAIVNQSNRIYAEVNRRYQEANTKITGTLPTDAKELYKELSDIAKIVFGRSFRVYPDFTLYNSAASNSDLSAALSYPLMSEAGPYAIEEWMYGVSRVRPRMGEYHKQMLLSESVKNRPLTSQLVAQFPDTTATNVTDCWAAMKLPAGYKMPADVLSLVIETDGTSTGTISCGMIVDEWPEQIPIDNVTTGIAMHYDQPSSEAPQSILIATTPEVKNYWTWNDLMDTLNETMDMAAIRAVEPDMIETSVLAQALPALVTQMSGGTATSPSLDFAKNIIVSPPGFDNPVDLLAYPQNPLNLNNLNPNS